tara:strand:+ start:416 stop:640 length:225 start_codon:yes stop_codon:yes gene_type:complete
MMNERIAELHNQCIVREHRGTTAFDSYVVDRFDSDKFAELIVQECANVGERYADGNYEVYNQIMAHFGLEEPEE